MSQVQEKCTVERRGSTRHACHRACLVRFDRSCFDGQPGVVTLAATVQDVSACGVGVVLPHALPPGIRLFIEPLEGSRPVIPMAWVVRRTPRNGGWYYGCALGQRLSDTELQGWLR